MSDRVGLTFVHVQLRQRQFGVTYKTAWRITPDPQADGLHDETWRQEAGQAGAIKFREETFPLRGSGMSQSRCMPRVRSMATASQRSRGLLGSSQAIYSGDSCLHHLMVTRYGGTEDNAGSHFVRTDCPKCKRPSKFHRVRAERNYVCQWCGHHIYPCVGTMMEGSRTPLYMYKWFYAMFLFSHSRHGVPRPRNSSASSESPTRPPGEWHT